MEWTRPIDIYCERLDTSFLSEPLNLFTNLAFIAAAFYSWKFYRQNFPETQHQNHRFFSILVAQVYAIGIGSFLFHGFANAWSKWADVVPIVLFLLCYLYFYLRNGVLLSKLSSLIGMTAYLGVSSLFMIFVPRDLVNGSNSYFGTFVLLMVLGIYETKRNRAVARHFYLAAIAFANSLLSRSIDQAICLSFSPGTHFLWHAFNGLAIYLVMRATVIHMKESKSK